MTRVTKEAAEANKRGLVDAAARLFREKGLDGVGVAEIARSAGLTHGAIYSGFAGKSDLAVAALRRGREAGAERRTKALGNEPDVNALLMHYVSKRQRDDRINCCPLLASASEGARQDSIYRKEFSETFRELVSALQAAMEREDTKDAHRKALAVAAGMIGAVAMARALDRQLSDELLEAARASFVEFAES
ncbi:TetR family transcriptional regulator [Paraburkholderia caribensis]|uniref:TetR/AcrR family transcriptional regulator n=1 Tax=Paraburkholderia caribensis TaxID=75105 RepID=UPI001CB2E1A1|nr:TetR family transcriptional regulator [Paraburkholderia caribensis]CAG9193613.1 TetR family transcriptional regulator [Paraburkholderia caribensis]